MNSIGKSMTTGIMEPAFRKMVQENENDWFNLKYRRNEKKNYI